MQRVQMHFFRDRANGSWLLFRLLLWMRLPSVSSSVTDHFAYGDVKSSRSGRFASCSKNSADDHVTDEREKADCDRWKLCRRYRRYPQMSNANATRELHRHNSLCKFKKTIPLELSLWTREKYLFIYHICYTIYFTENQSRLREISTKQLMNQRPLYISEFINALLIIRLIKSSFPRDYSWTANDTANNSLDDSSATRV